jgi:hypothetical protein
VQPSSILETRNPRKISEAGADLYPRVKHATDRKTYHPNPAAGPILSNRAIASTGSAAIRRRSGGARRAGRSKWKPRDETDDLTGRMRGVVRRGFKGLTSLARFSMRPVTKLERSPATTMQPAPPPPAGSSSISRAPRPSPAELQLRLLARARLCERNGEERAFGAIPPPMRVCFVNCEAVLVDPPIGPICHGNSWKRRLTLTRAHFAAFPCARLLLPSFFLIKTFASKLF